MPYNGSGSFSLTTSFTPATTILSSAMNTLLSDIATALSKVLTRDNEAPMTEPLRLDDGSEALPGLQFADDTNTGIRRSGADVLEFVTGGSDRVQIDANGKVWALGAFDVTGAASFQSAITAAAGIEVGQSDTTLTRTGAGDIAVEGNGIYRAGGTDVAIADGGTGASTAANAFTALKQAASDTATGVVELAIQSEMETATDVLRAVTPGRQHFHPGHPKFWGYATVAGGTPTLQTSYNVTSITDTDAGKLTVTIATDFSSANWCSHGQAGNSGDEGRVCGVSTKAAGSIAFVNKTEGSAAGNDPFEWNFGGFGDHA